VPCSQESTFGTYPEPLESSPNYHNQFPKFILLLQSHLNLWLPYAMFLLRFPFKIVYEFLISSMRTTCLVHPNSTEILVHYFTTLSVPSPTHVERYDDWWTSWKGSGRKRQCSTHDIIPSICLEAKPRRDIPCPTGSSNQAPSEYKFRAVALY
jgi:hypothetical protein